LHEIRIRPNGLGEIGNRLVQLALFEVGDAAIVICDREIVSGERAGFEELRACGDRLVRRRLPVSARLRGRLCGSYGRRRQEKDKKGELKRDAPLSGT
jgi:hypothetical protein